jgi:hypothetical protein
MQGDVNQFGCPNGGEYQAVYGRRQWPRQWRHRQKQPFLIHAALGPIIVKPEKDTAIAVANRLDGPDFGARVEPVLVVAQLDLLTRSS